MWELQCVIRTVLLVSGVIMSGIIINIATRQSDMAAPAKNMPCESCKNFRLGRSKFDVHHICGIPKHLKIAIPWDQHPLSNCRIPVPHDRAVRLLVRIMQYELLDVRHDAEDDEYEENQIMYLRFRLDHDLEYIYTNPTNFINPDTGLFVLPPQYEHLGNMIVRMLESGACQAQRDWPEMQQIGDEIDRLFSKGAISRK